MRSARSLLGAAVGAALLAAPAAAATRKLAADGTLHTIEVQTVGGGKNTGTALRHTRRGATTAAASVLVPGTEDSVLDREPAIEIDPTSGQLVLVWSRYDGDAYNIFLSRFNGSTWSSPTAVLKAAGDDVEPQVHVSDHYVHVAWRQILGSTSTFYRFSFLSTTLAPAYGPEVVRVDDLWGVPVEGGPSSDPSDPPSDERVFAGVVYPSNTTEPGRCHMWGVRDEPVPIGYRECILLPPAARGATSVEAGWLGGRFTLSYVSGSKLYYSTRVGGVWSPTRSIDLGGGVTAADARWIVHDLNARSAGEY